MKGQGEAREIADAKIQCEMGVRAEQLANKLQEASRAVEGWTLFAPLQRGTLADRYVPSVSLGTNEGVRLGYGFQVLAPDGRRRAYFKVTSVGPGGEAGIENPSGLNLRAGSAMPGAPLREYPQMGLSIQPQFVTAMLFSNSGRTHISLNTGGRTWYGPPTVVCGGGLAVGYDLSSAFGWSETHLRVNYSYLRNVNGLGMNTSLMPIDFMVEKGVYAGSHLQWYTALGWTGTVVSIDLHPPDSAPSLKGTLSSFVWGAALRTGFEIYLTPDWGFRWDVYTRANLMGRSYNVAKNSNLAVFNQRHDLFSELGSTIGLNWML